MAKKRKHLKKKRQTHPYAKFSKRTTVPTNALDKAIITCIFRAGEAISITAIQASPTITATGKKEIAETVQSLVQRNILVPVGKKKFKITARNKIYSGTIEKNPRGFGFVVDLEPSKPPPPFTKDPFITVARMSSANHGDTALIYVNRVRKDGRPEAEIISVLARNSDNLTGFYQPGKPPTIIPDDPRYPAVIEVTEESQTDLNRGDAVIVEIVPQPAKRGRVQAKIIEVLGAPENIDVQMRLVIENHKLPHLFPDEVLSETNALSILPSDIALRLDLRETPHITIDGADAKDFDDAIAIEKRKSGYRLYVSIADVSHFVKQGSALDQEAYRRGTSVYFPGKAIPMLPENLSNNLCSLVPHQDRLTFTAILDFNSDARLTAKKFVKTVIRNKQRFTYNVVKKILIDEDSHLKEKHKAFLPMLSAAKELAESLLSRRTARGSIGFNIPEADIVLGEDGTVQSIKRKERNFAHQIIEEFMLATNEAVAEIFARRKLNFLYRIHELPDEEKMEEFTRFAQTLGLNLPEISANPGWFAAVLDTVKDSPTEYVVNNLLLRTMQQARYAPENFGHFGLAAEYYTHFTSPIRRYPDLMVHRLLQNYLQQQTVSTTGDSGLKKQGQFLSSRERAAVKAEREMGERLKIFYMARFKGDTFKAIISGVTETSIYLELINLFVSGIIELTSLHDDYYLYDGTRHQVVGETTGKTYQIGAQLNVTLTDIDQRRRRIYFAPTT